jgi:hypothetical protein
MTTVQIIFFTNHIHHLRYKNKHALNVSKKISVQILKLNFFPLQKYYIYNYFLLSVGKNNSITLCSSVTINPS